MNGLSKQSDAPLTDASGLVAGKPQSATVKKTRTEGRKRAGRLFWQLLIVGVFLGAWQGIPAIPGIRKVSKFLDPFFISSPSSVAVKVWDLLTGSGGVSPIWPQLATTVGAALIGSAAGVIVGVAGTDLMV